MENSNFVSINDASEAPSRRSISPTQYELMMAREKERYTRDPFYDESAHSLRGVRWYEPDKTGAIDYDVLRGAPPHFNWSGIGDILCNHTGVLDWRYATARGVCEEKWPYDEEMAQASLAKAEAVLTHTKDIHALNQKGIEVLIDGLRWGTSFHGNGWNARHIEGIDHFFFYSLEYETGQKFIHGQPVSLGVYIGSLLHKARAEEMIAAMHDIGLDIRPEAMKVSWKDVEKALKNLNAFVREKKLWYSIAHDTTFTSDFVAHLKDNIEAVYGRWR